MRRRLNGNRVAFIPIVRHLVCPITLTFEDWVQSLLDLERFQFICVLTLPTESVRVARVLVSESWQDVKKSLARFT